MSAASLPAGVAEARDIVRFTRRSARRYNRARTSLTDLFVDVYVSMLAFGSAAALAVSFMLALRGQFLDTTADRRIIPDPAFLLPGQVLWTVLTFAALAAVVVLGRRVGPLAVGGPETVWWLSLPVDRRPLVWRPFLLRAVWTFVGAGVAYLPFSVLTALERSVPEHALAAATIAALAVIALCVAALRQLGTGQMWQRYLLPALALGAPAVVLWPSPWFLVAGLLLAVSALLYLSPRAGLVPGAELTRAGAVSGHVGSSLMFMDSNELLRAMRSDAPVNSRLGAAFFSRPSKSALGALLRADVVAFLRLYSTPTTAVLWLVACVAVLLVDSGLPVFAQLAVVVLAGSAAASGFGAVPRRTALVPELDGLVPVGPVMMRASRAFMPAVAMAVWMMLLTAVPVLMGAAGPLLMLVGALAGIGMGAGAVRGATRPPTDWSAPAVETPFGPVPRAQLAAQMRGLDVTVLSLMPVLISLYLGAVPVSVLVVQAALSAAVFTGVAMTNPHAKDA